MRGDSCCNPSSESTFYGAPNRPRYDSITFGLLHGRDMETFLTTGFLYGAPMAVVFARRDWEHAVGAHYMINMPSWVVAYLGT